MYRIGVDVGGTNIAMGIVDDSLKIIKKTSVKTADASSPEAMIETIACGIKELITAAGLTEEAIESVGVGVPGTAEPDTGRIMYANNLGFEEVPFLAKLREALGSVLGSRTFFDNDANAAALGEYVAGGYKVPVFMMVTLGTGIGGGIIIDGKVIKGLNYAAAEFGHMSINVEGVDCNCGRKGCFEDYASATALIESAGKAMESPEGKESILWKLVKSPDELDGEKFFEAVKQGDKTAKEVLERYVFYLSEGLINLINILQPDVLALSGGITRAAEFFLEDVKIRVSENVYSRNSEKNTEILVAQGIPDAGDVGIIGASLIKE